MKAAKKNAFGTALLSSDSYRLFFKSHPLPMWIYDLGSLAFLDVNDAAVEKYGYTRDEFLRRSLKDIRPPEEVERLQVDVRKKRPVLQHSGEWRHRLKDGRIIDVEITSHTIDFDGRKAVLVMAQDVTERKRTNEALLESEDRYRDLVENSQDLICTHDLEGNLLSINETASRLTGYSTKALMQMNMSDLLTPEARRLFGAYLRRIKKTGQARGIFQIQVASGEIRYWEYDNTLRKEGMSKSIVRGRAQDVTERVLAEKAVREAHDRMLVVLDSLPADIYVADINTYEILFMNQNMRNSFNGDLVGQVCWKLFRGASGPCPHCTNDQLVDSQGNPTQGVTWEGQNPITRCWYANYDRAIPWVDGQLVRLQIAVDITEHKQAEQALLKSQQETTHANRLLLALSQAAQAVQRVHTTQEVYNAIQDQISKLGYNATGFEFAPDGESLTIAYLNYNPKLVRMGEKLAKISLRDFHFRPRVDSIYHRAIVKGETVFDNNGAQAVADTLPKSLRKLARQMVDLFNLGPSIFSPLRVGEETIGVWAITGPDLTEADNPAVNAFACQAAIALQNAQLYERAQQEISERKQAEEGLQESNALLSAFMENSPIYAYIKEVTPKQSRVVKASENYIEMIGIPGSKLVGKTMEELFPVEFAKKISADDWDVVSAGKTLRLDENLNGRNYTTVKFPIRLADRDLLAGYTIDITERQQAEEALRKSEERYRTLAEAAQDMITVVNRHWQIEYANAYAATQFGGSPQELIGKQLAEIFPAEIASRQQRNLKKVFDSGQAAYVEAPFVFCGETIWLGTRLAPIKEQNGQVNTILIVSRDITERKQAEENLQNYSNRLEQDVNERTRDLRQTQEQLVRQEKLAVLGQLAGGVGHELRNPLAVINNAVYFLKLTQTDADDKVKEYLAMIEKEIHTAEKIITDLLDFARSKSVEREPVSVQDLVQGVLQRYPQPPTVAVSLRIPAGLPNVFIDRRQLEQVIGNLVINAFQAMPQGGALSLSAKKKGREVLLMVVDTGVGISPENLMKLFEPLFTTKLKGIGLGLAVSRKLVEANGGRIEVQSESGAGTTFTLFLPIEEGQLG